MKYLVMVPLKVKGTQGKIDIPAGQVVNLSKEAAIRLLNEGKVEPLDQVAVKIYSQTLDAYLWVVKDVADREALQGVSDPVYTAAEITKLRAQKPSPEALRRVHKVKQAFPGAVVREVKSRNPEARQEHVEKVSSEKKDIGIHENLTFCRGVSLPGVGHV